MTRLLAISNITTKERYAKEVFEQCDIITGSRIRRVNYRDLPARVH